MYASGSTVNSNDASDSEFSENSFASDSGSTDNSNDASDNGHQIVGLPMITPTHPQILGLPMIMLIYQQPLRKIIPLYQVNLR